VPRVLYPGSFDPLHNGHLEIIEVAAQLFGPVVVAVMVNPQKADGFFPLAEREALIVDSVAHLADVTVEVHAGLVVDAAGRAGADFIVKGVRAAGDLEVEMQMAHTNYAVSGVRTVFLPSGSAVGFISSRYIREIAKEGRDVSSLVPEPVAVRLKERYSR
jgi:pantetheine-phosphate adenylyltransferase